LCKRAFNAATALSCPYIGACNPRIDPYAIVEASKLPAAAQSSKQADELNDVVTHVELLELIVASCMGNAVDNEVRAQALLSLDDCMEIILSAGSLLNNPQDASGQFYLNHEIFLLLVRVKTVYSKCYDNDGWIEPSVVTMDRTL